MLRCAKHPAAQKEKDTDEPNSPAPTSCNWIIGWLKSPGHVVTWRNHYPWTHTICTFFILFFVSVGNCSHWKIHKIAYWIILDPLGGSEIWPLPKSVEDIQNIIFGTSWGCHEIAVKLESGWVTSYGILWGHQDFMFLSSPAFVQRARAARDRPSAHPLRWRSQLHLSKNGVPMDPQLAGEIWRCPFSFSILFRGSRKLRSRFSSKFTCKTSTKPQQWSL